MRGFKTGDRVIYRVTKCGPRPGDGAYHTSPSPRGELYTYDIDKYWLVVGIADTGGVLAMTRRGKVHSLNPSDACLRHAHWWERLFRSRRFPQSPPPDQSLSTEFPPAGRRTA